MSQGALEGKTAIITGGGTGIGRAVARAFCLAGANVVVCGRRLEPCEATIAALSGQGGAGLAVQCDVSNAGDVERLMRAALDGFGRVDILVNNAAIQGARKPLLELSLEEWQQTMAINLTGVLLCSQAAARHMIEAGGGKIINVASILGTKVVPNGADYCTSKGGLLQLSRAMALELGRHNVQVNAISPGYFHTEIAADLPAAGAEAIAWAKKRRIPAGRLGDVAEIGPLAVFLASDAGGYVTGSSLVMDGGVLLV